MKLVGLFVCYDWVRKRGVWHNMGCFESCSVVVYMYCYDLLHGLSSWFWALGERVYVYGGAMRLEFAVYTLSLVLYCTIGLHALQPAHQEQLDVTNRAKLPHAHRIPPPTPNHPNYFVNDVLQ
jgi:hypothetical protein